jgi:hypothetical protein
LPVSFARRFKGKSSIGVRLSLESLIAACGGKPQEAHCLLAREGHTEKTSRQVSWLVVFFTTYSCGTALDSHQLPPFKP